MASRSERRNGATIINRRYNSFLLSGLGLALLFNRGLRGGQTGHRHAERRAGSAGQTGAVTKLHGINAMPRGQPPFAFIAYLNKQFAGQIQQSPLGKSYSQSTSQEVI